MPQFAHGALTADLVSLACFGGALLLLDFFDISLPRGDSVGVAGALCGAAIVLFHPLPASLVAVATLVMAHVIRLAALTRRRLVFVLVGRVCALAAASALFVVLRPSTISWIQVLQAASICAAFLFAELSASQLALALESRRPFARLLRGSIRMQLPLLAAQLSAALLEIITFKQLGPWSLVPVVAVLLLMRQSYAMLLEVREAYRATVEVLVEAAEGQDERRTGHGERTAAIARLIAMRLGLAASDVERISYAALLHDVGALAAEPSSDSGASRPTGNGAASAKSAAPFEGIGFFADVLPVLRLCDGDQEEASAATQSDLTAAMIVALASDADAADNSAASAAHDVPAVDRVTPLVPSRIKAQVVGTALSLGYKIPAVS